MPPLKGATRYEIQDTRYEQATQRPPIEKSGGAEKTEPGPAPTPVPVPVSTTPSATPSISGRSLSDIMMGKTDPAAEEKTAENETKTPVDPAAQQKIERARDRFIERLVRESPRIGVVYETMEVAGGTVKVRVASEALAGEVQRVRTETLSLLAVIAGVRGPIELEVAVDETIGPARPIKTEDKLHHLVERNPNLAELRKTLDLDI